MFTETQLKMITPNGDIYRYIGSDIVDEFNIGDCADISFPNGYGKGKRTFQGIAPCLNTTTTAGCFIVKEDVMNLKEELCKHLIDNNLVEEFDVIKHSYSTSRMNDWEKRNVETNNISPTLDTRCDCLGVVVKDEEEQMENDIKIIGNYSPSGHDASRVVDSNGVAPTVKENHGTVTATLDEYNHKINGPDTIGTIQAMYPVQNHGHRVIENPLRIRKLTPTECFRLMGVKDEDSRKLDHLSNSTKYHLAGDSIVVNVLQAIFKSILIDNPVLDNKPIRLIEFFAGYGSQALSLKYLGIPFESWRICEWAYKSIDAYKHIHFPNNHIDYSAGFTKEWVATQLYEKGISANWNEPMKKEQINRKKEDELREIYNNCIATHNLINIQQVHSNDLDITDRDDYNYILTYSFPCQDLSLAGKGAGMEKGSGTRSGMLWEVERILEECGDELPQLLLMENVPQVAGTKNKEHFNKWIEFLESKGYTNKWCMLNAKEVGYPEPIPQNRNRCFMVSVLNPKCDIVFPEKTERTMVLKDLLEHNVDEKYYLSEKMIEYIKANNEKWTGNNDKSLINKSVASALNTNEGCRRCDASNYMCSSVGDNYDLKTDEVNRKYGIFDTEKSKHQAGSVYDENGLAPTLDTMAGGYRQPCIEEKTIRIKEATKQGYKEARDGDGVNVSGRMKYQRGNVQEQLAQSLTTNGGNERAVVLDEDKWSDLD